MALIERFLEVKSKTVLTEKGGIPDKKKAIFPTLAGAVYYTITTTR